MDRQPLTYAQAGVDVEAGDRAVALMRSAVEATHGPKVLG
ncbi:MAG: phosphoribosylformylglycinamidine cyclo-ligase, partial [Actinomycetota bacterium]